MASEVAQFLRDAFLASLKEAKLELPNRLGKEFQNLSKQVEDEKCMSIWSSKASIEFLYGLNDALAECRVFMEQQQQLTKNLFLNPSLEKFVWKMRKRLKEMTNGLEGLKEHSSSPTPTATTIIYPTSRHTSSEVDGSLVIGFNEHQKKVQDLLSDDKYKAIGVYGMCGSGKTAFVQKILSFPKVYEQFQPIIWICLSAIRLDEDEEITEKITKHILCQMGYDVDEWTDLNPTITELLEYLKQLLMSKKYLIVFDDVWQVIDFLSELGHTDTSPKRLSYALPKNSGGLVIITSRQKEVAEKMVGKSDDKHMIHMKPLNDENCKIILKTEIFLNKCKQQLVENWLNQSGFKAIGIYGPSCPTNTSLVDKVLKSSSVRTNFSPIIRVCVSDKDTPDMILSCILRKLNYENIDELMNDHAKLFKTLKEFLMPKNYLIVLEDARHLEYLFSGLSSKHEEDDSLFDRLSQALPKDSFGAVIVTTTGTKHVAQYFVGDKYLIKVNLADQNIDAKETVILEDLCKGLPLAARTVADIIREKNIQISLVGPSAPKSSALTKQLALRGVPKTSDERLDPSKRATEMLEKPMTTKLAEPSLPQSENPFDEDDDDLKDQMGTTLSKEDSNIIAKNDD